MNASEHVDVSVHAARTAPFVDPVHVSVSDHVSDHTTRNPDPLYVSIHAASTSLSDQPEQVSDQPGQSTLLFLINLCKYQFNMCMSLPILPTLPFLILYKYQIMLLVLPHMLLMQDHWMLLDLLDAPHDIANFKVHDTADLKGKDLETETTTADHPSELELLKEEIIVDNPAWLNLIQSCHEQKVLKENDSRMQIKKQVPPPEAQRRILTRSKGSIQL